MSGSHRVFDIPGADLVFEILYLTDKHGLLVPKEVAVGSVDIPQRRMVWMVAPPYPVRVLPSWVRKLNNSVTKNSHGMRWDDRGITLADLYRELREIAESVGVKSRLYALTEFTVDILEEATGRCIINLCRDIDPLTINIPMPKTEACSWHRFITPKSTHTRCALQNLKKLQCRLSAITFENRPRVRTLEELLHL